VKTSRWARCALRQKISASGEVASISVSAIIVVRKARLSKQNLTTQTVKPLGLG